MAKDDLHVFGGHGLHDVHARPIQSIANLLDVMVTDDEPFVAIELLEDRCDLLDRHILAGEISEMPNGIGRPHRTVPLFHEVPIVLADVAIWAHGHIENAKVTEMGVRDEVVAVVDVNQDNSPTD